MERRHSVTRSPRTIKSPVTPFNLGFGLRLLRRSPGFSIMAISVLALGIGATTTMLGVIDAVLLRPLPYPEPDRLVQIWGQDLARGVPFHSVQYPDVAVWRQESRTLDPVCAFRTGSTSLTTGGDPESADLARVNAELLEMLGAAPVAGRFFIPEEDAPGAPRVAVVSHAIACRHFGTAAAAIDREVVLDGAAHRVVGILPAGFWIPAGELEVVVPLAESGSREEGSSSSTVSVLARLAPGRTMAEAQSELDAISLQLDETFGEPRARRPRDVKVWGVHEFLTRRVRQSVLVLSGAVAMVLLIACVNVASLLLARAGRRRQELAVRSALGADRKDLVWQLLSECGLLAAAGGLAGMALAWGGTSILTWLVPNGVALIGQVTMNARMLVAGLVISLLTTLIFGLGPALSLAFEGPATVLRSSVRSQAGRTAGIRGAALRRLLVVAELAASTILLVAAGLLLRSFIAMQAIDPGFDPEGAVTCSVTLRAETYSQPDERTNFFKQMLDELHSAPGITAAGMVSSLPLTGHNQGAVLVAESGPIATAEDAPIIWFRLTSPGYFRAMRIPLIRGRLLDSPEPVADAILVNQAFAARFWPGEDPIGKRVAPAYGRSGETSGEDREWQTVVGVVGDVRHMRLTNPPDLELFMPYEEMTPASMRVVVRTALDTAATTSLLATAAATADPGQAVSPVLTMEEAMSRALASGRMSALLLALFAGVALLLAAVGLYGVIAYSVSQRTAEIGVRMALGADRRRVLRMVLGEGLTTTILGLALGLAVALAATRLLQSMLYQISTLDVATFLVVTASLLAVALLATWLPARRATQVDPLVALREL
jgi:putative ABC transport system permease protein